MGRGEALPLKPAPRAGSEALPVAKRRDIIDDEHPGTLPAKIHADEAPGIELTGKVQA